MFGGGGASNLKSKFCLSLAVCGVLTSLSFGADTGINFQINNGKIENVTDNKCTAGACIGQASEKTATGGNVAIDTGDAIRNYLGGVGFVSATGNTLTMTNGAVNSAMGGAAYANGSVSGNTATMSGGMVKQALVGGLVEGDGGSATSNTVNFKNGTAQIVGGGVVGNGGTASGNTANMSGGTADWLAGGKAGNGGTASGNTANMSGGTADWLAGGNAGNGGTASGNTANMSGGTASWLAGGNAEGGGTASGNTANMSGGTVSILAGGTSEGEGGTASGNIVNFTGGTVGQNGKIGLVVGGSAGITFNEDGTIEPKGAGDAINNTVNVSGGKITEAGSGITGGATASGKATGNKVFVSGGDFTNVSISGAVTHTGEASGNIVEVSGGKFGNTIDIAGANIMANGGKGINNTVILSADGLDLSGVRLYGADDSGFTASDKFTGNTLEVWGKGITAKSAANFQNYYFILPTTIQNGDTMLKVTEAVNLDKTTIGVAIAGSGQNPNKLVAGDKVTLIDAPKVEGQYTKGSVNAADSKIRAKQGISLDYDFSLNTEDGKKLVATLDKIGATEESKALSEGTVAGAAIITEAGDIAAGKGMDAAVQATNQNPGNGGSAVSSINPFSGMGASSSRRKTGSHVDTNSIGFLVGVALGREFSYGKIIVGPFFEAGFASYDTHNDLSDGSVVKGSGHTRYFGGGILARYELNKMKLGTPYVEGSLRVGRNKNSFNSSDIGADYDTSATYWGAHAGLGFIWDITDSTNIDTYVKYFYNRIGGDSAVIKSDPYDFEAVNSHKLSGGFRLNHEYETASKYTIAPYAGAGYEYEFDGTANAYTNGYAIDTPTLGGGSGRGEIGVVLGKSGSGLKADLGVAGYVGLRRGVAGNITIKYEF